MQPDNQGLIEVPVWDGFVRVFHWSLVLLFAAAVVTGKLGGEWIVWHMRCGYAILTLVVFRILWGFFGSAHARFADFLYGPRAILGFLQQLFRPSPSHVAGHNPLGGWMVLVLLLLLLAQAIMGLFSNDEIATTGPLYRYVSEATSITLMKWHRQLGDLLLILVAIHIAAVLFHLFVKKEGLVRAMLSGRKSLPETMARAAQHAYTQKPPRRGLGWLLASLALTAVTLAVNWPQLMQRFFPPS